MESTRCPSMNKKCVYKHNGMILGHKNDLLSCEVKCMELKDIILSGISQEQESKYHILLD
jgi:hypothetical protein